MNESTPTPTPPPWLDDPQIKEWFSRLMFSGIELPPGWDFEPLHKTCPKCGCDLSKEFVAPESDKPDAEDVEDGAHKTGVARRRP